MLSIPFPNKLPWNICRERIVPDSNFVGDLHEYKTGERKTTVAKTVQYWFNGMWYSVWHNVIPP